MSADPLRYFRIEARELIDQISAGVLNLDQQPGPDEVARLLRYAHTLKGAARVVKQVDIADRAHAFEEVLVAHRADPAELPADEMRELLRLNDEIEAHVRALEPGAAEPHPLAPFIPINDEKSGEGWGAGTRVGAGTEKGASSPQERAGAGGTPQERAGAGGTPQERAGGAGSGTPPERAETEGGGAGAGTPPERAETEGGGAQAPPERSGAGASGARAPQEQAGAGARGTEAPQEQAGAGASGTDAGAEGGGAGAPPERPAEQVGGGDGASTSATSPFKAINADKSGKEGVPGKDGAAGAAAAEAPAANVPAAVARSATADVDELLDAVGEAHARFAPLRAGGGSVDRLHRVADALADQLRSARTPAQNEAARSAALRLSGELAALGRRLTDTVEQVERELDEVRGRAERLRLVAASSIFTAMHRAVRDAADGQGKRVRFEGRGGDLRMDPQVLTLVSGAFLHVVRNAVAHGIEAGPDRAAAGKPAEGHVVLEVERRGRFAAFRCTDDGRGFDLEAVRRTAEARGLLMPGGTAPDQRTLVDLILRGGISTSAKVTEVSGRGIGLDVARDVADQLGGEVSVRTEKGRGSTVELVVPLLLLSLHGLVLEAAGTIATVPLDAVRTCVRLLPDQAASAAATGRMAYDGRAVPFLPLARALYAGTAVPDTAAGPGVAVIVADGPEEVAVGVDRLAGTSTLVVRPLPELAPAAAVIGGVSMDLDGNPRLVLDAHGLISETVRSGAGSGAAVAEPARKLPILVVDDSLTTRMLERSILESAGYEVDLAASGEEGLEKAGAREYGLYLTDIDMPGIDGFTFVARTRADPALSHVPAILVSSRASAEDRQRGAAAGASAYVVKGEFNQEELLAHIRRLVNS